MTGPEHYEEAELLLRQFRVRDYMTDAQRANCLAEAQVHATLALVAAFSQDANAWLDACS